MIDYAYATKGVFYHGTISDIDGTPKSTWTLSVKDKKEIINQPIDQDTFAYIWNGVTDFDFFKKALVTKLDTHMDFNHFQVIAIAYKENGGQAEMRSFLVDPNDTDLNYKKWVAALHVPLRN
jgi:hypothetical protein